MIILSAPSRICGARSLGIPLCWLAYGKIAYSSRTRSVSVRTEPFTMATGLPAAFGTSGADTGCDGWLRIVGACDATWALAAATASRRNAQLWSWILMIDLLIAGKKGEGGCRPLPGLAIALERCGDGEWAVHFVGLATVALPAELRCLIAAQSGACGVVGSANEEH